MGGGGGNKFLIQQNKAVEVKMEWRKFDKILMQREWIRCLPEYLIIQKYLLNLSNNIYYTISSHMDVEWKFENPLKWKK